MRPKFKFQKGDLITSRDENAQHFMLILDQEPNYNYNTLCMSTHKVWSYDINIVEQYYVKFEDA